MSIIGVNGKIGSGKDTVGKIIQYLTSEYRDKYNFIEWQDRVENYGSSTHSKFEVKKFAGKLKTIASLLTGIPVEMFEDQDFKKTDLSNEWVYVKPGYPARNMSVRELLQKLGTEAMRDGLHTNVWCNALFSDYVKIEDKSSRKLAKIFAYPNWIITDMRFPNEMEAVVERKGITIRVHRDLYNGNAHISSIPHASETALDNTEFDYEIINDGSIKDLIEKVKQILITEKII